MWHIYLDESGDLGFDFKEKQPSKFLTIAILATSQRETVQRIGWAVSRTLRKKVNKKKFHRNELKGTETTIAIKRHFFEQIAECEFGIYAVTLNKQSIHSELRANQLTKSRLYNYLARLVLEKLPLELAQEPVTLVIDKSKGRREIADFNNYISSQLKARLHPKVPLSIYHHNSCDDRGLSAVDLFCWGVFRRHERGDIEWYDDFKEKVLLDDRYL